MADHEPLKHTSALFEAIGSIDEVNACLGVALAFTDDGEVRQIIIKAQSRLFVIGAELAGTATVRVTTDHVDDLRKAIDRFAELISPQTTFLLPNGTKAASFLHLARTVTRRAERAIARLEDTNPDVLRYLNRLSSLLYVLARYENRKISEQAPTY